MGSSGVGSDRTRHGAKRTGAQQVGMGRMEGEQRGMERDGDHGIRWRGVGTRPDSALAWLKEKAWLGSASSIDQA